MLQLQEKICYIVRFISTLASLLLPSFLAPEKRTKQHTFFKFFFSLAAEKPNTRAKKRQQAESKVDLFYEVARE